MADLTATTDLIGSADARRGEALYEQLRAKLEEKYFGQYVMINIETGDYVTGTTISDTHAEFLKRNGSGAAGWCTRIGVSAFVGG
jgi:hypothetical protein